MSDRLPPGTTTAQSYKGQILGTDENGYVRKIKVDSTGDLSVDAFKDKNGLENFNAIFGEKYVAHRKPAISANFNYAVDTRKIFSEELNGATVGRELTLLTLSSGVSPNGEAYIQSKENLRYRAGRDSETMFTCRFDLPIENNSRCIGLYAHDNGFFVGYKGLQFGATVRKDSVDTFFPQSEWNKDKCDGTGESGFNWDFTKVNIVRITYGYLGIAPVLYQVYGGLDRGWVTFHVYDVVNVMETTHIDLPYLPLRAENINTGNTTNVKLQSGSIYCGTIDGGGCYDSSSREFSKKLNLTMAAGTDTRIIVFHNKATYQGVSNRIDDQLLRTSFSTDGTKVVNFSLYKLSQIPVGGTWTDVRTLDSNMEVSLDATIDLTDSELMMSWSLGKTDSLNDDVHDLNLLLFPDEYAVFTYTSTGASDIGFTNRWSELF